MARLKILFVLVIIFKTLRCEDLFATINPRKSLNVVDEKFLSIVIDPMILLSGLNISDTTLSLARHLSPAFIRFNGPSTPSFIFSDDESTDTEERLTVTPDMWTSLNEWIAKANLTGVFALTDRDRVNEAWNAKTVLPLMELADRMSYTCYWEITNEYSNNSLSEFSDDIDAMLHIQDAFPKSKNVWKTIAGEMSQTIMNSNYETVRKFINSINGKIKAINWNPTNDESTKYVGSITKYLMTTKPKLPVWTNAPRFVEPTSFINAMQWAKFVGDAAKEGYDVIFRQPKIREFYESTPAYWATILHKHLMGRNVLEMRSSNTHYDSKTQIYAHCTKHQSSYPKRGAVTLFMVNSQEKEVSVSVKFMSTHMKNAEIESYILTTPDENTSAVFLNGELLHDSILSQNFTLHPKIYRKHIGKYLTLSLPAKSIAFFVVPNAKLQACISGEHDDYLLNQDVLGKHEELLKATPPKFNTPAINMSELYKLMEKELESNEKYYEFEDKRKEWKDMIMKELQEEKQKFGLDLVGQNQEDLAFDEREKIEETNRGIEMMLNKLQEDLKVNVGGNMDTNNVRSKRGLYLQPLNPYESHEKRRRYPTYSIKIHKASPEKCETNTKEISQDVIENLGNHQKQGKVKDNLKGYQVNEAENGVRNSKDNNKELMAAELDELRTALKEGTVREKRGLKEKIAARQAALQQKREQLKSKMGEQKQKFQSRIQQKNLSPRNSKLAKGKLFRKASVKDEPKGEKQTNVKDVLSQPQAAAQRRKRLAVYDVPDDTLTYLAEAISNLPVEAFIEEVKIETDVKDSNQAKEDDTENQTCPATTLPFEEEQKYNELFNEPIIMLIGQPVDPTKMTIDDKKRQNQIKFLKDRLALRRRLQEKWNKNKPENIAEVILSRKRRGIANYIYKPMGLAKNNVDSFEIMNNLAKHGVDQKKYKEAELLLNEISKEGKDIAGFLNEAEEDIYKIIPKKIEVKSKTMPEEQKKELENKESTTSSSTTTGYEKNYTVMDFDGLIRTDDEESSEKKPFVPKFQILNHFFDTLADLVTNFHNKVVNYAVFLAQ